MRAFLTACIAAAAISLGAWIVLVQLVQEPVSAAFATSAVRN